MAQRARRQGVSRQRVQALCFDLDGTLLDGSGLQTAIHRTCEQRAVLRPGLDMARLVAANRAVWQDYWPEVEDLWTHGALDGAAVGYEAWRRTLRACGCTDEAVVYRAVQIHRQLERATYRLFDDVHALFTLLRRVGVPRALITNGASDTQRDKLRVLGVEDWFDAVVISGDVGRAKPDAAIFRLALNQLAAAPEQVWHVGDSLTTDVAGAQVAGLTAVWLNRSGRARRASDPAPDVEIASLAQLLALLAT